MPFNTSLPLTTLEPNDVFDLTIRGLRSATFAFTAVNRVTGVILGSITPIRNTVPSLTHDTSRSVKRALTLTLNVADTALLDPISSAVRVTMVMADGQTFRLGRYIPVSISEIPTTAGTLSSVALVDEMFIIAQPISASFAATVAQIGSFTIDGVARGSIYQAIQRFLDRYNVFNVRRDWGAISSSSVAGGIVTSGGVRSIERNVEFTNYTSTGSWRAGVDGTTVLNDLALNGDYFTPWMSNDETFRMLRTYDPVHSVPSLDLDAQKNVFRDSVTRSNDLLNAPNRIIVTSNAAQGDSTEAPVVGMFDLPSSAPHSIANRGFIIAEMVTMQVSTRSQADAIARNIALNKRITERVELTTPPDPRHDSYNVVRWDDELWLEVAWSMALVEGGGMRHTLQRIYQ